MNVHVKNLSEGDFTRGSLEAPTLFKNLAIKNLNIKHLTAALGEQKINDVALAIRRPDLFESQNVSNGIIDDACINMYLAIGKNGNRYMSKMRAKLKEIIYSLNFTEDIRINFGASTLGQRAILSLFFQSLKNVLKNNKLYIFNAIVPAVIFKIRGFQFSSCLIGVFSLFLNVFVVFIYKSLRNLICSYVFGYSVAIANA